MAEKPIRLDSQFSAVCAFWAPETANKVRTGTLTVDEQGVTFTTAPEYDNDLSMARLGPVGTGVPVRFPALHGFTEHGPCTLLQMTEISRPGRCDFSLRQSITAVSYRALTCVMEMYVDSIDDKCLESAQYTFSGLSEWLPKASTESWESDHIIIKIPYRERDIVALGLLEGRVEFELKVHPTLESNDLDNSRVSRSVPYFKIRSTGAESLGWYLRTGNRLENLFSLLTGASLALETIFVYKGDAAGTVIQKRNHNAERPHFTEWVRCTASELAKSISIWFSLPARFQSVESLALGVLRKSELFSETEFLSLAQALEGLHRATTNTDLDFRTRMTEICGRLSGPLLNRMEIEPLDSFVGDVVATRNFYTHAGGEPPTSGKRQPLEGPPLFFLNQKLKALLRGVTLRYLEIPEERLFDVLVKEATQWR